MKSVFCLLLTLLLPLSSWSQANERIPLTIGESFTYESAAMGETRRLNVYLPPSYGGDSLKRYPVIYLLDGGLDEDFVHISGLVQFCTFPWVGIMEEMIVVGIANVDRKRDFTYPSTQEIDRKEFPTSGGSAAFITFLTRELPGVIGDLYRVTGERTIIGQSLGGLLASEVAMNHPEAFEHYIIVSPSLWWDAEKIFDQPIAAGLRGKSVYVGGGKEGAVMERLARTLFYKFSTEKGSELRLFFGYFAEQDHGDALHLAVYDAFEKIFKPRQE